MYTVLIALVLAGPVSKSDFLLASVSPQKAFSAPTKETTPEYLDYKRGLEIAKLLKKKLYVGTNLKKGEHLLASAGAQTEGAIYCIDNNGLFETGVTKFYYDPEKKDLFKGPVKIISSPEPALMEESCANGSCSMSSSGSSSSGSCASCSGGSSRRGRRR